MRRSSHVSRVYYIDIYFGKIFLWTGADSHYVIHIRTPCQVSRILWCYARFSCSRQVNFKIISLYQPIVSVSANCWLCGLFVVGQYLTVARAFYLIDRGSLRSHTKSQRVLSEWIYSCKSLPGILTSSCSNSQPSRELFSAKRLIL